jgi:hypothetical protein
MGFFFGSFFLLAAAVILLSIWVKKLGGKIPSIKKKVATKYFTLDLNNTIRLDDRPTSYLLNSTDTYIPFSFQLPNDFVQQREDIKIKDFNVWYDSLTLRGI